MIGSNVHLGREWAVPRARGADAAGLLSFTVVAALLTYRVLSQAVARAGTDGEHWGLIDFRDAIYYPVTAFVQGHNPYDAAAYTQQYPVSCVFPVYSPLTLLLHLPFGLLTYEPAALCYLLLSILLTVVLAWLVLRMCAITATVARVFLLASLILVSRGGYVSVFLGQYTFSMVIAAYTALHFARTRPLLAGIGLALCSIKPTFGGPLAILMLVRGDVRATLTGAALAVVAAAVPAAVLAHNAGGAAALLGSLSTSYEGFSSNPTNNLVSSALRIDAAALLGRLLGAATGAWLEAGVASLVLVLGAAAARLAAQRPDEASRRLSDCLVCLTTLTCVYHQVYDVPLLVLPLVALAAGRWVPSADRLLSLRWLLVGLLGLPMVNYVMSRSAFEAMGISKFLQVTDGKLLALASVNGAALLVALLLCAGLAVVGTKGAGANPGGPRRLGAAMNRTRRIFLRAQHSESPPLRVLCMFHVLVCWTRYVIPRSISCDEESRSGTWFGCRRDLTCTKSNTSSTSWPTRAASCTSA